MIEGRTWVSCCCLWHPLPILVYLLASDRTVVFAEQKLERRSVYETRNKADCTYFWGGRQIDALAQYLFGDTLQNPPFIYIYTAVTSAMQTFWDCPWVSSMVSCVEQVHHPKQGTPRFICSTRALLIGFRAKFWNAATEIFGKKSSIWHDLRGCLRTDT